MRDILLKRAAAMRRELRDSRLGGYKFRRQAIIGKRIADFFCPARGLIVELDGETHDRESDLRRDRMLWVRLGFCTLRFTNEDVMRNMDGVLRALKVALDEQPDRWPGSRMHHPPAPSSEEEGE